VFEPRSNTTRRNLFQTELVDALECADEVVVAEVARLEQLPVDQRLNPERLIADLQAARSGGRVFADGRRPLSITWWASCRSG
jgi:UDP-N-acetylmuramate: L-alanyl-gamma-D-glutamyl-meso-diaminopimelate ligase